jgi:hypothetical protein
LIGQPFKGDRFLATALIEFFQATVGEVHSASQERDLGKCLSDKFLLFAVVNAV